METTHVTMGYGHSAYSYTAYGRMRMKVNKVSHGKPKHSERGMCRYTPPKRTGYDTYLDFANILASYS